MSQKQTVTKQMSHKYNKETVKEKGEIVDSLIGLTGYNRSYAARVLRNRSKHKVLGRTRRGKHTLTLIEDERTKRKARRKRAAKYKNQVFVALVDIPIICDWICGKGLAPYLAEIIPVLERFHKLDITDEVREKLLTISAASIDQLLTPVRKRYQLRGRSHSKPGN